MVSHVAFGKQLLAFPAVPPELRLQALQETVVTLDTIVSTLHLDPRRTMKLLNAIYALQRPPAIALRLQSTRPVGRVAGVVGASSRPV